MARQPSKKSDQPIDDKALTGLAAASLLSSVMTPIGAHAEVYLPNNPSVLTSVYFSFSETDITNESGPPRDIYGVPEADIFCYCKLEDMDSPFDDFAVFGYQCVFSEAANNIEVESEDEEDDGPRP